MIILAVFCSNMDIKCLIYVDMILMMTIIMLMVHIAEVSIKSKIFQNENDIYGDIQNF